MSRKLQFLFLLVAVFLVWKKGTASLDPDFGWHWRMGQLITSAGIPKTDPFSYTMPSFPFVDHEWLVNIIFYKLSGIFGYNLLVLLFSLLAISSLVVAIDPFKKNDGGGIFKTGLLLLAIGAILPFSGLRPQVLSWLFLAVWLRIVLNEKLLKKCYFLLPVLLLVWTNLHGSFAVGIFCLGVVFGLRTLRTKRLRWQEILCFLLCFGVTFVNPYDWRLWGEVWQQISDSSLRWRITEWNPSFFTPVFPYLAFVSLGYLIYFFRQKIAWEKLILYLFFLVQSFLGLRYIPLFVIVSLPIYLEVIGYLYEKILVVEFGKQRWQKVGYFWLGLCILIAGLQSFFAIKDSRSLSEKIFYPFNAISFLRKGLPEGNLLSQYNWGGYLIWQLPEKKVFIDGRMPSWRWKANLPNESNNAMEDYLKMLEEEKKLESELIKYNITTVLWPNVPRMKEEKKQLTTLEDYLRKIFRLKEGFDFIGHLEKNGWQEVYKDKAAIVYSKQ